MSHSRIQAALAIAIDEQRDNQNETEDKCLPIGGNAEHDQNICDHRHQNRADHRADDGSDAAHHGCAADDNRRDDVHFRARANRRLDGREARAVNHTGKAGHHGDEHIGQNLHFIHIDARQSRGFLIAADRQNFSS